MVPQLIPWCPGPSTPDYENNGLASLRVMAVVSGKKCKAPLAGSDETNTQDGRAIIFVCVVFSGWC